MKNLLSITTKIQVVYTRLRATGILVVLLAFQLNVLSQTTIYIDPTNTSSGQNGSIANPYDSWTDFSFVNGNTYLQKRGTTYTSSTQIYVGSKSNIRLGAYGTGERPLISYTGSGYPFCIVSSSNCTVENFEVNGNTNAAALIRIYGTVSSYTTNNTINNCLLYNAHNASSGTGIHGSYNDHLSILNTEIHNVAIDGIYLAYEPNVEIGYCNIYDVNRRFFVNPDQTYSSGDGIQLDGNYDGFYLHHTTIDRTSGAGNKYDLILNSAGSSRYAFGIIEYCTFKTGPNVSSAVHIEMGDSIITRYNVFKGSTQGIKLGGSNTSNNLIHNNLFYDCKYGVGIAFGATNTKIYNNVFYHVTSYHIWVDRTNVVTRNNIHMRTTDAGVAIYNYGGGSWTISNNCYSSAVVSGTPGTGTNPIIGNPNFINPATGNFNIQSNSVVIDHGIAVGIAFDMDSTAIFQGTAPEIGAFEYLVSSGSNLPPVINSQSFSINENSANGTAVGTVVASDPNSGQILTYSITGGNTSNTFAINANTGALTVANSAALNFESTPAFQLTVRVQDNGTGLLTASAIISVNLTNVNENPVITNQNFAIASYSQNGTVVGTIVASDPDLNQTLSYSITAGNTSTAFAINAATGAVTVANSAAVNYLINPVFNLTIRVQDNGSPVLSSSAAITITVTSSNSAPVITAQAFSIPENSVQGTIVGQVVASDTDPGQILSYSITAGNTAGAFQIGANGMLSIANSGAMNFETTPAYQLSILVSDNGQPQLSASASVSVTLINVNELPAITGNTNFSLNEHVAAGTLAGTITGMDPDAGQTLTFNITAGNTNNAFAISASTGQITVIGSLSFESYSLYTLTVSVSDNGSPSLMSEATCIIQLLDVNEEPEIADQGFLYSLFAPNGTVIGIIAASDPDLNQIINYSIASGNSNGAFALNATNGTLTVANSTALNPEIMAIFTLNVLVQDNGNPTLSSSAIVTVNIDAQNYTPIINSQIFSTNENRPLGSIVGTVIATDPNAGQPLAYSIVSGNSNDAFSVSSTGVLSIKSPLAVDYETTPVFILQVLVSDNGIPVLSAQASITINVSDVNDPPVMLPQTYTAIENSLKGRYVCKVIATDQDPGDTYQSYIIAGNTSNAFTLQANTSRMFVNNAAALNYEVTPVFYLTIRSVDNHGAFSEQTVTINLIDVNEAPVVRNQNFMVNASSPNGTIVGTVIASDPDQGQSLNYAITLGNTYGIFGINQNTGEITLVNASALFLSTINTFKLTVKVSDNGSPILYSNGFMTINVTRAKESNALEVAVNSEPGRLNLSLTVYPNPSSDGIFNIKFDEELSGSTTITITDLAGKILAIENPGTGSIHTLNLGSLPSGIYLMHAKSAEKQSVSKLIRQ